MKAKMKRTLSFVLAVMMLLSVVPMMNASAATVAKGKCGDNITWKLDGEGTLTLSGSGKMYDYKTRSDVPWKDYYLKDIKKLNIKDGVESIGAHAFEVIRVEEISLPSSVKSIGYRAFAECKYLKKFTMNDGVETIGNEAFKGCQKLSEVKLSAKLKEISEEAFYACDKLKGIVIPSSVTEIGKRAFYCCTSLQDVTIENGLKKIDNYAFYYCNALESITFPASVKDISLLTFQDGENLKSISVDPANPYYSSENGVLFNKDKTVLVKYPASKEDASYTIPSTVKTIESYAFEEVSKLKELIISEGVTTIKERAFDCASIPTLTLPSTVKKIGKAAFKNCRAENIVLASTVTEIGEEAFYACKRIESFVVPENVKTIGRRAFEECENLSKIYIPASVKTIKAFAFEPYRSKGREVHIEDLAAWCKIDFVSDTSSPLYVGSSSLWLNGKKITDLVIPEGVTEISDYAFSSSSGTAIKSVKLPSTLKSIGSHAFEGNYSIKSLTIPASVTAIGDYAFSGCDLSEKVTISKGLKTIGKNAFADTNIKSITIPEGVTKIGSEAFSYCYKLESVSISKTVSKIGENAFTHCDSLKKIKVNSENKNYKAVKNVLFNKKMTKLIKYPASKSTEEYTVPKTVTTICKEAFYGAKNLATVKIQDGVKTIGDFAFEQANKITAITLPNSVKAIGRYAFSNMKSLKTVKLPKNLKKIPDGAFARSRKLKNVTLPNALTTIGNYAFENTAIEAIKLPAGVYSIGEDAFGGCYKLKSAELPAGISTSFGSLGFCADEYGDYSDKISGFTIKGYKGSSAEEYAKAYGFKFVALKNHTHKYNKTRTIAATQKSKGSVCKYCTVCGKNKVTTTIPRIKSVKLSTSKLTYNGKAQAPTLIVKDTKGNKLKEGTDFTVEYSDTYKNVGKYYAVVTFKGKYEGEKVLEFTIRPKKTAIASLKADKESITVNWNAQKSQTTGYEIRYSTSKDMTDAQKITVAKKSASSAKIEKLDSGVKYYVQIRTYKIDYSSVSYFKDQVIKSAWSDTVKVTVK